MSNKKLSVLVGFAVALLIRCSSVAPLAGGSDNPDFVVMGSVQDVNGKPARNTIVSILPQSYNPVLDIRPECNMSDTTDSTGNYRLGVVQKGFYTVQAKNILKGTRLLLPGIAVTEDTFKVPSATLSIPGRIVLSLSEIKEDSGYVYIPGTDFVVSVKKGMDSVTIDSVPSGTVPVLAFSSLNSSIPVAIRYDVPVEPEKSTLVSKSSWRYSHQLYLNTTKTGANVSGDVVDFPVLIRLNEINFDFSQARQNGGDIRFEKADGSFLPYEIECWEASAKHAEIWVKIDTVYGNTDSQYITMFWGNSEIAEISDSSVVFDTASKFIGVWHMNEKPQPGIATLKDQTANAYHATSFGEMGAENSVDGGAIGKALSFDGIDDYLDAGNVPVSSKYTIGFWVLPETLGNYQRFLYKDSCYTLWYDKDSASIRMEHMSATTWWRGFLQDGGSRVPVITGSWQYITGTFDGTVMRLYKNGTQVSISKQITVSPRTASSSLLIGKSVDSFVKGIMDEIRIEGEARSADWIRLCYMNQRPDDKLIQFK